MSRPTAAASGNAGLSGRLWPRRVLMTADALGGVWPYAMDLARGFARRDIAVLLAIMGDPPSFEQRTDAAAIAGLCLEAASFRLEWMAGAEADLRASGRWLGMLERDFMPDIVHLNGYAHADLGWQVPAVVVAHSCVRTWWRAVRGEDPPPEWDGYADRVRRGLDAADLVIAPTAAFLSTLTAAYGELAATRVVANGRTAPTHAVPRPKDPLILCAGRLWDEAKNVSILDAAAEYLPWPIHVAGSTERPDGAPAPGLARVRPLGPLAEVDLRRWLDRAAIYASPAVYEPFGLAVLEAAQSGCALVLGDIATLRELWEDAAVFVAPRDRNAWARTLASLCADPAKVADLGARAAERAKRYSAEAMVEGTLAAYDAAAGRAADALLGRYPPGWQAVAVPGGLS